jgi:hypothetical protein
MRRAFIVAALSLCVSACAPPRQGFVTTALGGTVLDALPGTSQSPRSNAYVAPDPGARPDTCALAARNRADETKAQGFDEDTQRRVYTAALEDCRHWRR